MWGGGRWFALWPLTREASVWAPAGEQAAALVAQAGGDPDTTRLLDLFAQQPTLELPDGRTLTAVSSQTQWADGEPLSMTLLSAATPDLVLPPASLAALGGLLHGQLVVCAASLPADYIAALLAQGAKGVVCGSGNAAAAGAATDECSAFFAAFYDALLAGQAVVDALQAAEQRCPPLTAAFQLCTP